MALPDTTILTDITRQYQAATTGWYNYLFPIASHLFGMLAVIELAWSGIWWAVEKSEVSSLWSELLKKIMSIGFFYAVLVNAPTWIPEIIKSFMLAGSGASHLAFLDPSSLLDQGISVASSVFVPLQTGGLLSNPGAWIVGGIVAILILCSFVVMAGLLVVTLVESYIVVGAGVLMLGFSSSRWTTQYASNYLSYAVSVGSKLFVLYLIVGIGSTLASSWSGLLVTAGVSNLTPFFEVLGGALVLAWVAWEIPNKAASLVSGATQASLGGAVAAAAATSSMATMATMGTARMAAGAASGLKEAAGQAYQIGKNHLQTGGGLGMAALKGGLSAGLNTATSMIGTATGQQRSTGSAMAAKTDKLRTKYAERAEQSAATNKSGTNTIRPSNPPPPNAANRPAQAQPNPSTAS